MGKISSDDVGPIMDRFRTLVQQSGDVGYIQVEHIPDADENELDKELIQTKLEGALGKVSALNALKLDNMDDDEPKEQPSAAPPAEVATTPVNTTATTAKDQGGSTEAGEGVETTLSPAKAEEP